MGLESERVVYNPLMVGGGTPYAGGSPGGLGFGSGGLLEGLILASLLGRNGNGGLFGGNNDGGGANVLAGDIASKVVNLQNTADIKGDIGTLGNEMQAAFATQTQTQTMQFNDIQNLVMNADKTAAVSALNATIQGLQNTQSIKDQAASFQVVNQENFCSIKEAIHADGDATRGVITQNLIDGLRAELAAERRGRDAREVEITVTQTNQQTQNQLQAQLQAQSQAIGNALNMLGDQVNRANNSIVNLGSGAVTSPQTNNQANTKVNS